MKLRHKTLTFVIAIIFIAILTSSLWFISCSYSVLFIIINAIAITFVFSFFLKIVDEEHRLENLIIVSLSFLFLMTLVSSIMYFFPFLWVKILITFFNIILFALYFFISLLVTCSHYSK